jgi:flagellar hook-associated protein 2
VVADNKASGGSYAIEIEQLAQSQKLKSRAFESEFDSIGSGTLTIEFGAVNTTTGSFDLNASVPSQRIEIDPANNSLRGIQQSINQKNMGVHASIINDGTGYLLILNSEKTGRENSLRISVKDDDGIDTDLTGLSSFAYNPVASETNVQNLEETAAAKDAVFSIDGISITNSQNEIKDSVPGISLTLKKTTDGTAESFSIEKEVEGVKGSIKAFVSSYNELMNTVNTLTGVDPETGQAGPLSGDASIRGIVEQIRRRLSTSFNGINENLSSLSTIGIDSSRDGTLTLDDFKLDKALRDHAGEIAHLFSAAVTTSDPKIRVSSEKIPSVNGSFAITIKQTPTQGTLTGQQAAGFPLTVNEQAGGFSLSVDNIISGTFKIPPRMYATGNELATELQRIINSDSALQKNNVAVRIQYINNAFEISSNSVGSKSLVSVTAIDAALTGLTGLFAGKGTPGTELIGTVNGYEITGTDSKLKLEGELSGIVLDVSGNQTGERGELIVTNGVAAILDDLTNVFLANNGLLDSRVDGYNARIKDVTKQREALVRKLEVSEERYLKQFSNLDAMLGKMRSTSNFLAEKLSPPSKGK